MPYPTAMSKPGSNRADLVQAPKKPHRFRSLTGCLTCRRRKKKCDETRPKCMGCNRNHEQCIWPPAPARRNGRNPVPKRTSSPEEVNPSVPWLNLAGAFLSPLRASALTKTSSILFAHYLAETSGLLSALPRGCDNPFLTVLVPLCCNDDLLMHSLLALSGSHMGLKSSGIEVYTATYRHYSIAIRTLRDCICDLTTPDTARAMRILIVLMMLSLFESLTGNAQAAMFSHLRASRQLVLQLVSSPQQSSSDDSSRLLSFVLGVYRYLVLINSITPFGAIRSRALPDDTFLDDFVSTMTRFDTNEAIFGGSHGLFRVLPSIAALAARRLTEQDPSPESSEMYQALHVRIAEWKSPEPIFLDQKWRSQREAALALCREAALLYMETAMFPNAPSDTLLRTRIQDHVDTIMLRAEQAAGSPCESILLCPLIIAGSCMVRTDQRQCLQASLRSTRFHMDHYVQAAQLLELVWNDPSERIFGPYGLGIVMQRHEINLGVA
ncbi:fungal-specific transcription factor domain-containing protein [Aspergillus pseudotamarii]|uniref:Fungal-specific transcription factor domain-containing protein n=1 Tax=Aspergillus pseudotamarii TaxID=132259 RepID=A0A5N6T1A2_ASPPS|nr:fungal-specific transcription factor domain-containing protein [Aspergillus pseudotamarii]KAE8140069.1 fungal-specific transcription factor domain-containing protein [Aspergillus pseudotamarii]